MIDILVELVGFALVAAFFILMFHTWGVLAAGVLFLLVANIPHHWRGERS